MDSQPDDLYFQIEHNLRVPPPLDPHIASLTIRTGSNNPSEYFDLSVSATFGQEVVTLVSGDETIDVKISIRKAEIIFDPFNASFHLTPLGENFDESWRTEDQEETKRRRELAATGEISGNLSARSPNSTNATVNAQARGSYDESFEQTRGIVRTGLPWRIIDNAILQLGYLDNFEIPLSGRLIDETVSIRVTPTDLAEKVGVLGRIRVRSSWIDVTDLTPTKVSDKLKRNWGQLWGTDAVSQRRRELFERLLAHLVAVALQSSEDTKNATIAASAIVFSPVSASFAGTANSQERGVIRVDPTAVESFLSSPFGGEEKILRDMGIAITDADIDCRERLLAFLSDFVSSNYLYYHDSWIQHALSRSLGMSIETTRRVEESKKGRFSTSITIKIRERITAASAKEMSGTGEVGPAPFGFGQALVRGSSAFALAKALGFKMSYQSLQKKISPFAVKTSMGNLVTCHELAASIGAPEALHCLIGSEFTLKDPSPHF